MTELQMERKSFLVLIYFSLLVEALIISDFINLFSKYVLSTYYMTGAE